MWSTTLHGVLYYIYWGICDDGGSVQPLLLATPQTLKEPLLPLPQLPCPVCRMLDHGDHMYMTIMFAASPSTPLLHKLCEKHALEGPRCSSIMEFKFALCVPVRLGCFWVQRLASQCLLETFCFFLFSLCGVCKPDARQTAPCNAMILNHPGLSQLTADNNAVHCSQPC